VQATTGGPVCAQMDLSAPRFTALVFNIREFFLGKSYYREYGKGGCHIGAIAFCAEKCDIEKYDIEKYDIEKCDTSYLELLYLLEQIS